ncbi:hypothetical protein UFOVP1492_13 [uncultured Caudovirales phage]|uniref:Uncharacterized protein n=1 Tax=uncultured Caudovirales phage TaxID=2100421 RepID=A0A6J5SPX1_9CAUD|nr:hypothetical protein UFOVP1127_121 [uncultured Caudovirales phage]CAB4193488.1 hypothetical protein UFOVP1242_89 [uncultured Caudovirales phage]CAB4217166.1 hypothetical protein UFOVP1492_13 [uncultured Caudovirales phage]CAB5231242.1 hypothetical protein UFOVP1580_42 [uncultured Caudovirales phage]
MKFTHTDHPLLQYFITGKKPLFRIILPKDLDPKQPVAKAYTDAFGREVLKNPQRFAKCIECVTKPFQEAVHSAALQISKLVGDREAMEIMAKLGSGCLIIEEAIIAYQFGAIDKSEEQWKQPFMVFYGDKDRLLNYLAGYVPAGEPEVKLVITSPRLDNQAFNDMGITAVSYLIVTQLFKAFTETQTKVFEKSERGKFASDYYKNNLSVPITILDSTYFTNIIVEGGFPVTGHWRWQPVGEGRSERSLIWIKEYEKKGYKRKAKKDATTKDDISQSTATPAVPRARRKHKPVGDGY